MAQFYLDKISNIVYKYYNDKGYYLKLSNVFSKQVLERHKARMGF